MNRMHHKGYDARIDFDEDDDIFVGRLAGIDDIVTFHAETVADLKNAFHEAVDDYVETCAKIGKTPQKPHSGNLMLRIDPELHAKAVAAADLAGVSLNQFGAMAIMKALDAGHAVVKPKHGRTVSAMKLVHKGTGVKPSRAMRSGRTGARFKKIAG